MSLIPKVPKILYKYKACNEYLYSSLVNPQVYFSSPIHFNDPFDCSIPIRYDLVTQEEHLQFAVKFLQIIYPNKTKKQVLRDIDTLKSQGYFRSPKTFKKLMEDQLSQIRNKVGILCLTPLFDNLLMWSHYGDSHRGVCIGYDSELIYKNTGAGIGKVVCSEKYPEIKFSGAGNMHDLIIQTMTKSTHWDYEKEYRFLYFGGADRLFEISPETIQEIYLGCKISVTDKDRIEGLCKKYLNHVKLYQLTIHESDFKLVQNSNSGSGA